MTSDQDTNAALLEHAQRQTKALQNINVVLMTFLVLFLVGLGILIVTL